MLQSPFIASLPLADLVTETPERFHDARHNFAELFAEGCYRKLDSQAFYLLEITGPLGMISYGVCGMINTLDYGGAEGGIRPHEATLKAREARQRESFLTSTHFIKPVLLTCPTFEALQSKMVRHCQTGVPAITFLSGEGNHIRLFVIDEPAACANWKAMLTNLPAPVAVADGHHRISTARQLACEAATAGRFSQIPAVLIPADSLVIDSYLCSITDPSLSDEVVLAGLEGFFKIERTENVERPIAVGHWLLAKGRTFYDLKVKTPDERPGTTWFDELVLPAVFGITDSTRDPRWVATPSGRGISVIHSLTEEQPDTWHFLPPPADMGVFFRYLEKGMIFPPKSTRFLPRIPSGLIVREL